MRLGLELMTDPKKEMLELITELSISKHTYMLQAKKVMLELITELFLDTRTCCRWREKK